MKILFVTSASGIDYLSDCVFHGLVSLGHEVVDSRYLWYLSSGITLQQKANLYGRGFTLAGNLPDRSNIDRSKIKEQICNRYYDIVVYGSVMRSIDYIDDVLKYYKKNEIVFCNGEDDACLHQFFIDHGVYFKRELYSSAALPISFAIPEEKLCNAEVVKTKEVADMIPGTPTNRNYIYSSEIDYYRGYQEAKFGITMKKAGWDCLRHYEIAANKCLPFFKDYQRMPKTIMTNWPTDLQLQANSMFESKDYSRYDECLLGFFEYCKKKLTTKALGNYILTKI